MSEETGRIGERESCSVQGRYRAGCVTMSGSSASVCKDGEPCSEVGEWTEAGEKGELGKSAEKLAAWTGPNQCGELGMRALLRRGRRRSKKASRFRKLGDLAWSCMSSPLSGEE